MTALSPGVLDSSFEMLDMTNRMSMSLKDFSFSFPRIGVCKVEEVESFVRAVSWIRIGVDGNLELTVSGKAILDAVSHESRMRQAILDYVRVFSPAWLQNASFGRDKILSYAGANVRQVIFEAGLATGFDQETICFWDSLAAMARGQQDITLSEIGRRGERLTVAYEMQRTGRLPKWISVDNNADGYDVLSVVAPDNFAKLSIEVKATTLESGGRFYVTRNEWERAQEREFHCFHLWILRGKDDAASMLAVVFPENMRAHVPVDKGCGEWQSFQGNFSEFHFLFVE
jgi:hypothetical protein